MCGATHVAPLYAVPRLRIIYQAREWHRTMRGHMGGTVDSKAAQIPRPRPVPPHFRVGTSFVPTVCCIANSISNMLVIARKVIL